MYTLQHQTTTGSTISQNAEETWRLELPPGTNQHYRWAQLDDYQQKKRQDFLWKAPFELKLKARVSENNIPGTWGFGLWNDPFSANLGIGGTARRLPALPNTIWFFYASPPNHLAFQDTHPAQGFLAATFASYSLPLSLMALGAPSLPLLFFPPFARILRRLISRFVQEDAALISSPYTEWHQYTINWLDQEVIFLVDNRVVFKTPIIPQCQMGLVIWIDNQYASFTPDGKLKFGTLAHSKPVWLEFKFL
jgi:hypothetical protein